MKFNYNKLKGRIKEKEFTLEKFANELGISYMQLYNKLNNKVGFRQKEIFKAIEILDIKDEEVTDIFFKKEV